ncbi:Hypothetical protein BPA_0047300 (plasmid) [Borrelia parkeri SLO]|uniref:Uncharacterized protein n=1 Tax=Borrelia parkeri SLO TaxID=1313294 RepID=W5ST16_BORPR|nr:hypothetical protein [Borrelia parkeri]AHH10012.1 Hypothetical protein BPA_0047300 [Borrelia parkeri SLO]UPA11445.1 hypothetical protein bpSLO_001300 [Borrelia parkeri]
MKFLKQFLSTFKKDLKNYLFCNKFATTQIYYKSEIYTCTTLKLPAIVFALKSIGEVVLSCKDYSFGIGFDFLVYTHNKDHPTLGLEVATLIVNFLVSKYYLKSFTIDDSQVIDDDLQDSDMVTVVRVNLGIRINGSDLGLLCVGKES